MPTTTMILPTPRSRLLLDDSLDQSIDALENALNGIAEAVADARSSFPSLDSLLQDLFYEGAGTVIDEIMGYFDELQGAMESVAAIADDAAGLVPLIAESDDPEYYAFALEEIGLYCANLAFTIEEAAGVADDVVAILAELIF